MNVYQMALLVLAFFSLCVRFAYRDSLGWSERYALGLKMVGVILMAARVLKGAHYDWPTTLLLSGFTLHSLFLARFCVPADHWLKTRLTRPVNRPKPLRKETTHAPN